MDFCNGLLAYLKIFKSVERLIPGSAVESKVVSVSKNKGSNCSPSAEFKGL